MGIRKRISHGEALAPVIDNVSNPRADDARGVCDPRKSPVSGSYMEAVAGDNSRDGMRTLVGRHTLDLARHGKQPHPQDMPVQDLLASVRTMDNPGEGVELTYRNRVRSPLTGIRGFCVHVCKSGSPKAVSGCTNLSCVLWPFRMGKHGMR
jgi:hypothetical protein